MVQKRVLKELSLHSEELMGTLSAAELAMLRHDLLEEQILKKLLGLLFESISTTRAQEWLDVLIESLIRDTHDCLGRVDGAFRTFIKTSRAQIEEERQQQVLGLRWIVRKVMGFQEKDLTSNVYLLQTKLKT